METLRNLTLVQWIGIMVGLNSLLMGATPQLTVLFGTAAVPIIVAIATLGNGALGVFVTVIGGQSAQVRNVLAMPGVEKIAVNGQANAALAAMAVDPDQNKIAPTTAAMDKVTATAKAAASVLFAFIIAGLMFAQPAMAQTRKLVAPALTGDLKKDLNTDGQNLGLIPPSLQVTPTGNVSADLQTLWGKIISASNADLAYASKLAAGAGTQSSLIRKQCWDAIVALNTQANGLNLKNADGTAMARPDPHLFTDVETLAEVVDNLSPQGPLFTSCAGAAQLAKTNVLTFINAAITGAAGMAAMPIIPGL